MVNWSNGMVAVEGVDHPVAVRPHLAVVVEVDAVRVGVAGRIEPVAGAVLAPVRRGQQSGRPASRRPPASGSFTNASTSRSGRQAGQVEADPAGERAAVGLRRGVSVRPSSFANKPVDRISDLRPDPPPQTLTGRTGAMNDQWGCYGAPCSIQGCKAICDGFRSLCDSAAAWFVLIGRERR